jgi:hypothetical protein
VLGVRTGIWSALFRTGSWIFIRLFLLSEDETDEA